MTNTQIATSVITPERLVFGLRSANTPAISPDGMRIAYSLSETNRESGKTTSQLWLINPMVRMPATSPRGHTNTRPGVVGGWRAPRVHFETRRREIKHNLRNAGEGGESREVVRHLADPLALAWSPDGATLAYTLSVDPDNPSESPVDTDAPPKVRATRRLDYKQDNRGYLYDARLQVMLVDCRNRQASASDNRTCRPPRTAVVAGWKVDRRQGPQSQRHAPATGHRRCEVWRSHLGRGRGLDGRHLAMVAGRLSSSCSTVTSRTRPKPITSVTKSTSGTLRG